MAQKLKMRQNRPYEAQFPGFQRVPEWLLCLNNVQPDSKVAPSSLVFIPHIRHPLLRRSSSLIYFLVRHQLDLLWWRHSHISFLDPSHLLTVHRRCLRKEFFTLVFIVRVRKTRSFGFPWFWGREEILTRKSTTSPSLLSRVLVSPF